MFTADWVLPISGPPIRDGAVVVENDQIVFVGLACDAMTNPAFDACVKRHFGQAAIIPGLINAHSHLELTVMRGFLEGFPFREWILKLTRTRYERLTAHDLQQSALLGTAEAIRAGITTTADTGDSSAAFGALLESGMRGIAYREVFGPDPVDADKSLEGLKQKVDEMRKQSTSLVRVGVSPHAPYTVSAQLFSRVTKFAGDESLDVCIHAAESKAETLLMRSGEGPFADGLRGRGIPWSAPGVSTIDYLNQLGVLATSPLLVHCVSVDDDDVKLIAQSRARVAHCPKSNAKLGHGVAPLSEMIAAGIAVGLGTDSVASNNLADLIEEGRFCSLVHRSRLQKFDAFSADQILKMITIGGAEALGLQHTIGTLETGKQADLVVIDLSKAHTLPIHDPATAIVFAGRAEDVTFSMVAGRVLLDDGKLTTLDEVELKSRVESVKAGMD